MYFVWKRNDGHVAATTYRPNNFVGGNGDATAFEHIGQFDDWSDAYDCIASAREADLADAIKEREGVLAEHD
jgi:hypothetical protein